MKGQPFYKHCGMYSQSNSAGHNKLQHDAKIEQESYFFTFCQLFGVGERSEPFVLLP